MKPNTLDTHDLDAYRQLCVRQDVMSDHPYKVDIVCDGTTLVQLFNSSGYEAAKAYWVGYQDGRDGEDNRTPEYTHEHGYGVVREAYICGFNDGEASWTKTEAS